jgi:hypothetical protein
MDVGRGARGTLIENDRVDGEDTSRRWLERVLVDEGGGDDNVGVCVEDSAEGAVLGRRGKDLWGLVPNEECGV